MMVICLWFSSSLLLLSVCLWSWNHSGLLIWCVAQNLCMSCWGVSYFWELWYFIILVVWKSWNLQWNHCRKLIDGEYQLWEFTVILIFAFFPLRINNLLGLRFLVLVVVFPQPQTWERKSNHLDKFGKPVFWGVTIKRKWELPPVARS